MLAPQPLHELVGLHCGVGVQREHGQDRTLLCSAQTKGMTVHAGLERAEKEQVHALYADRTRNRRTPLYPSSPGIYRGPTRRVLFAGSSQPSTELTMLTHPRHQSRPT